MHGLSHVTPETHQQSPLAIRPIRYMLLMPTDAANPPNPEGAIHLAQIIKHRPVHRLEGLIVFLDTCDSGAGAWDAVE